MRSAAEQVNDRSEENQLKGHELAIRSCMRLLFSSPLTGVWKTVLKTEYMRVASLGVRVGQMWENVSGTNGTPPYSAAASSESGRRKKGGQGFSDKFGDGRSDGRGMGIGKLGFFRAEVGSDGRERTVVVKPGTRTTSFCMLCVFCMAVTDWL